MFRRSIASSLALIALASGSSAPQPRQIFRAEEGPIAGESWALARRAGANPAVISDAIDRARTIRERTAETAPEIAEPSWGLAGPTNIGGRVVDLAVHPTVPNLLFVASAGGGVWRTDDAGVSFSPAWPDDQTQSMGALAISATGSILYAGTGEANPGGGSLTYPGSGVYRSSDNGDSWESAGLADSARIGRLAVSPRDERVVYAAVAGDLFEPGGPRGIYRSTNAGRSWTRTLAGRNGTTGGIDIAIDPSNPDRVFAALWDHQRTPGERRYQGPGSSVWRSLDAGTTWARLELGLGDEVGRIGLAISPILPSVVYADVESSIYSSEDGGNTWGRRASEGAGGSGFEWWFGRIWVDPLDPLHLFRGSIDLQESFDGGDRWTPHTVIVSGLTSLPTLHADHHAMVWDPIVRGRVYLGNDGGVFRGQAVDGGLGWLKGGDQPFTQFYSVDVAEDDPSRIVGGAQDNGSLRSFRYTGVSPDGSWNRYVGGDGEATAISPANHDLVYGCSQYGGCTRSTTAGEVTNPMNLNAGTYNWFTPIEFDPNNPGVMYSGGSRVVRSGNSGGSWQPFSPRLPQADTTGSYPFGTITTVAASPVDESLIIAGTDDGLVWIRRETGWTDVSAGLPGLWVSRVALDSEDPNVAFVAVSGYRAGNGGAHVYRTDDLGDTWTAIGAALPPAPVNDIVVTARGLMVATDVGVFLATDPHVAQPAWLGVGGGLPLAPVTDIRYHAPSDSVFAATFGRGIWRVSL